MNARFWIWWNLGWVKITLRPGQAIDLHAGARTDEGYWRIVERYSYDLDSVVQRDTFEAARDCDGPTEDLRSYACRIEDLKRQPEETDEYGWRPARPLWERVSASQRDHYAEAMGY